MDTPRLTPLDASFLEVESPNAHMHVGWVALFEPPPGGVTFEQLREHIGARLDRAPRYRQKLATVPFGFNDPVWVDDERFDVDRHVFRAVAGDLGAIADAVFSVPLARDRPLWELWIADGLDDGRIGVVGKAHHCMVDGIAAVEIAALLLDATPDPPPMQCREWRPAPEPTRMQLLSDGLRDAVLAQLDLMALPARIARSPQRVIDAAGKADRVVRALGHSLRPAPRVGGINQPISPYRMLARASRPLEDLTRIKARHAVTINDVVLAASAGGVRRFLEQRGQLPIRLKAMVPVNVRTDGEPEDLGNHISFIFVELPCDEPDPLLRLTNISYATSARKRAGEPQGANAVLQALAYAPQAVQRIASRLVASPRAFNLVVSNIPGPREPLYMCGAELLEAYPVVPLADRHALSIGFTTIRDTACFGIYADRESLPDARLLAQYIDDAIDELLDRSNGRRTPRPVGDSVFPAPSQTNGSPSATNGGPSRKPAPPREPAPA